MANFYRVPGGQPISNTTVVVDGNSLTVGLNGLKDAAGNDLVVTNGGDDLSIFPGDKAGAGALYTIRVNTRAAATKAGVTDTIFATGDLGKPAADRFNVQFQFKTASARDLIVRDVTREVYGAENMVRPTCSASQVIMSTFRPGDQTNAPDFQKNVGSHPVSLSVFAAKLGEVERSYWVMLPVGGHADSLMVVISHGFGQNHAIYAGLGYSNPLSKPFLDFVLNRFVMGRWGQQVAATRPTMGLIMPLRSGAPGGELGPFLNHAGVGAHIITRIMAQLDAPNALNSVNLVTFSSGIYDANTFIATGGRGLKFNLMVNQDPAHGTPISGNNRKQYLSGYTTGGPRAGFEYMPDARWLNDPRRDEMKKAVGREYLHTWAIPTYTLAMALS